VPRRDDLDPQLVEGFAAGGVQGDEVSGRGDERATGPDDVVEEPFAAFAPDGGLDGQCCRESVVCSRSSPFPRWESGRGGVVDDRLASVATLPARVDKNRARRSTRRADIGPSLTL
jgi:hypothetical protein